MINEANSHFLHTNAFVHMYMPHMLVLVPWLVINKANSNQLLPIVNVIVATENAVKL